jgi:hypothetical protein
MTTLAFRRAHLVGIARDLASQQLAGDAYRAGRHNAPVGAHLQTGLPAGGDRDAAFVAHCLRAAGFTLPPGRLPGGPDACPTVPAWIAWATASGSAAYYPVGVDSFVPDSGDLLVFADLRPQGRPDHIGVIIDQTEHAFIIAAGNVKQRTGIVVRRKGRYIHGYILLLEGDESPAAALAARVQELRVRAATRRGSGWRHGARTRGAGPSTKSG